LRVAERTETPLPAEGGFAFVKIGSLPGSDLAPPPRRGGKGGRR
jgi:16S rRNA (cytosine1402-N4)-methyltransferase